MTLPSERYQAVINTRAFLRSLLDPKQTPRVPKEIRREAYWCLKHFPSELDLLAVVYSMKSPARLRRRK